MRDHNKLAAFRWADDLAMEVYSASRDFPRCEEFGLKSQMRRAAVSIAANIAEGCGRRSGLDYLRFLSIAQGSTQELAWYCTLARRLGYIPDPRASALIERCSVCGRLLTRLQQGLKEAMKRRPDSP